MVSQLKSETARTNGARSRGPTTGEGKEKSSRNSLKHSLTAGYGNILLDCENPNQFDEIFNKFQDMFQAVTPAFRTLADDSRSLALASRYEARLQRPYDRAYKTLRELQQTRESEPPQEPHNIVIRWVDSQEALGLHADDPSVSEGADPNQSTDAAKPTEPRASASGPAQKLRNEPTAAAIKEVSNDPSSPEQPTEAPAMQFGQHLTSNNHPRQTRRH